MNMKRWLTSLLPFVAVLGAACGPDPVAKLCGNGGIENNFAQGILEFCDDGNAVDGDGCDSKCRIEFDAQNHVCNLDGNTNGFGGCCNSTVLAISAASSVARTTLSARPSSTIRPIRSSSMPSHTLQVLHTAARTSTVTASASPVAASSATAPPMRVAPPPRPASPLSTWVPPPSQVTARRTS